MCMFPTNRRYVFDVGSCDADLYGPTCMPSDMIASGVSLGDLEVGDIVEFGGCGGYGDSLASQFSFYRPIVVLRDISGGYRVIRGAGGIDSYLESGF